MYMRMPGAYRSDMRVSPVAPDAHARKKLYTTPNTPKMRHSTRLPPTLPLNASGSVNVSFAKYAADSRYGSRIMPADSA